MHRSPEQPRDAARVAVLHLIDTLEVGGAERMAANIVNGLPRDRYRPLLCATRRSGPLADALAADVPLVCLRRRWFLDLRALRALRGLLREQDVRVLHAHDASVVLAVLASRLVRGLAVVWHVHAGRLPAMRRRTLAFRLLRPFVDHVVTVSQPLSAWARVRLGMRGDRISQIPNFVTRGTPMVPADLPGAPGQRIVCVANFIPEKGHGTLLAAMARVARVRPSAHLLLVGQGTGARERALRAAVHALGLEGNVSFLGQRRDVDAVLAGADVGVLSSDAEGLPLALIEYGEAALAAVVTDAGQCADVVGHGDAGVLVPPAHPAALADALLYLLAAPDRRRELGAALHERVTQRFQRARALRRLCAVYDRALRHAAARVRRPAGAALVERDGPSPRPADVVVT